MVVKNDYDGIKLVSKEFGMSVTAQLASIEARVLPPPMVINMSLFLFVNTLLLLYISFHFFLSRNCFCLQLKYHESGREKMVNPRLGQWNMIDKVKL